MRLSPIPSAQQGPLIKPALAQNARSGKITLGLLVEGHEAEELLTTLEPTINNLMFGIDPNSKLTEIVLRHQMSKNKRMVASVTIQSKLPKNEIKCLIKLLNALKEYYIEDLPKTPQKESGLIGVSLQHRWNNWLFLSSAECDIRSYLHRLQSHLIREYLLPPHLPKWRQKLSPATGGQSRAQGDLLPPKAGISSEEAVTLFKAALKFLAALVY
ncbi:MAG: hypothetical protein ACK551_02150 [Vampirovibrionales bacterium]